MSRVSPRSFRRVGATTALTVVLVLCFAGLALAKTWTVTTTADSNDGSCTAGKCSLRDAVAAANADTGDTVAVPASTDRYLLNSEIQVNSPMTIQGAGPSSSVIDAQQKSRAFYVGAGVGTNGTVAFSGITITGGSVSGLDGGGVFGAGNSGNLVFTNDDLSHNRVLDDLGSGVDGGGAITTFGGNLTLTDTTVSDNSVSANGSTSSGFDGGGGLYFAPTSGNSMLTLIGSTVSGNSVSANDEQNGFNGGGGLYVFSGSLTMRGTTVSDNTVSEFGAPNSGNGGGGIFLNEGTGPNNVIQSTVSDNTASAVGNAFGYNGGGGILGEGSTLVIDQSTVAGNTATVSDANVAGDGGGGVNYAGSDAIIINASTISGNAANLSGVGNSFSGGGGVQDSGVNASTYTDSTISGNTTSVFAGDANGGGGVNANNTVELTNVTIAGNSASVASGGGVVTDSFVLAKSSIIAQNTSGSGGANCDGTGTFTSAGYNLEDRNTCNFNTATDTINTNPDLALLASNGGPTQTRALQNGSPAIDAIPLGSCTDQSNTPLTLDQRLVPLPDDGEGACDIGAYQSQEATPVTSHVNDATTNAAWRGTEKTGARAYDTAAVAAKNGVKPTGTISYTLFSGNSCAGAALSSQRVTLTDGNVPNSSFTAGLSKPAYSYSASYSGDSNYQATAGACEPFSVIVPPASTSTPHISGKAKVGKTLHESHGSWVNNLSSIKVRWLRCNRQGRKCKAIRGATHRTYKLGAADAGHLLAVRETATGAGGSTSVQSASTVPVTFVVSITGVRGLTVSLKCHGAKSAACPVTLELTRKRVVLGLAHGTLKVRKTKTVSAALNRHGRRALASRLKVELLVLEWGVTVASQSLTL